MQVSNDMEKLQLSEEDIMDISKETLKDKIDKEISNIAFSHLKELASTHSKVNSAIYEDLNGMDYFSDPRFTPDLSNLLFKFRTRMYNVRNNFRNNYKNQNMLCPICADSEDSQEHLFECKPVWDNLQRSDCKYEDIFSNDCDILLNVATILNKLVKIRDSFNTEQ